MFNIGNYRIISSNSYLSQLERQLRQIEVAVEGGRAVTIRLVDGDRQLTLAFAGGKVSETLETIAPVPGQKPFSLADNEGILQGSFAFDLQQANRKIPRREVHAQLARHAALTVSPEEIEAHMGKGLPLPKISQIGGGEYFLVEDCSYRANDGYTITVLKNFKTDLASIPRFLMPLIVPRELSLAGPMFHDLIYRTAGRVCPPAGTVSPETRVFERHDADDLFLELMTREKVNFFRRNLAYAAVRLGGRSAWRSD